MLVTKSANCEVTFLCSKVNKHGRGFACVSICEISSKVGACGPPVSFAAVFWNVTQRSSDRSIV